MLFASMNSAVSWFLLLSCCLVAVRPTSSSAGPVFVNAVSPVAPAAPAPQDPLVTQTVYGFLDFTTTIGNTVMVFSPQSMPADEVKSKPAETPLNAVIDTKPVVSPKKEVVDVIKPSKTIKAEKKAPETSKKVVSHVQVQSNPPETAPTKVEIKAMPITKVNVIEGIQSVVNVAPIVSSKVKVVEAPASKASKPTKQSIITKVEVIAGSSSARPPQIVSSRVEVYEQPSSATATPPPPVVSLVEVHADEEPALIIGNNIGEPEYDFLSRQPSEVVEETYKVINLKPSSKFRLKPRASAEAAAAAKNKAAATKRADSLHPTGLVTKLGGTVVKDGTTTVHETSVIGTYISGKYAQVLKSTSQVYNHQKKAKINPSPTLRILKTAAPSLGKNNKHRHLEPTPSGSINDETALPVESLFSSQNSIKSGRKPGNGAAFKRFKNRQREQEIEENEAKEPEPQHNKKSSRHRPTQPSRNEQASATPAPSSGKRYNSRRNKQKPSSTTAPETNGYSRRGFKPKIQPSTVESNPSGTSLYKFKLNRSPGRWQYKTTPKPRITIRKQPEDEQNETLGTTPSLLQEASPVLNDVATPQARSDDGDALVGSESVAQIIDDESSTENKLDAPFPLETIKVEISTPPDFKDIYYEIATIKSPYTFQVGSVKNTRYVTVTSTFEKSLERTESTIAPTASEPLTENILATSGNYDKDNNFLDSSIATLPPLYLASDIETPPLETLIETFSTLQTMLKTHILPVVKGGNETSSYTLVQTYVIERLVTATKTLPPMDAYHFNPSRTLNEFNSHLDEAGSELHLELEFGDENDQDDDRHPKRAFPADLDLANIGSDFDLSDVDRAKILEGHFRAKKEHSVTTPKPIIAEPVPTPGLSPEQLQQLALLRLLNPAAVALNPVPQGGQVITTSKPVLKVETVYESHVIPVIHGQNTILSTISRSVGTITKTEYEYGTSTIPTLPIPPANPLFPQQPPQFAVTTSPVIQSTVITQRDSKILKLTFGAKTAYTTIYSTKLVPTVLTTYMTASVPVQPTAAFPGYFPAPYPPFPYVG